jgi:hypothetical protein
MTFLVPASSRRRTWQVCGQHGEGGDLDERALAEQALHDHPGGNREGRAEDLAPDGGRGPTS